MKIGKVSESILKRSVLKNIKTKRNEILNGAGVGDDCAVFAPTKDKALVSCMQEAALKVEGRETVEAGEPVIAIAHLFQRCVNNLATRGAEPIGVSMTLLLPEDFEEPQLKRLMQEAEQAAEEHQLQITGGQTKVSGMVKAPYGILTGFAASSRYTKGISGAKAGQDLVISKWIGLEGTAMLAERYRDQLKQRYPAYLVEEAAAFGKYLPLSQEAAIALEYGVSAMHDASYGGIFAALWELAEGVGIGLTVDLKKIPLRQETVEVCEYCQVNPYELLSGGALVMACADGSGLAAALEAEGIPATVVGRLTDSKDRIICNEEEVRYMDRPRSDEIYRILSLTELEQGK